MSAKSRCTQKAGPDEGGVLICRVPQAVVERIDQIARDMMAKRPGLKVSRSDVIRQLLYKAIEAELWLDEAA